MAVNGVRLPRFFRVFLSETCTEALALPKCYLKHLAMPLPLTAKLQGTGGNTWTVGFIKIRGRVYFTDGWSKFAGDHDLKDGEILTFVYDGLRTFEVSAYSRFGCKEIRAVVQIVELSDEGEVDDDEGEVDDDEGSFGEIEAISSSIYPVTEYGGAVVAQRSNPAVTTPPFFTTKLKNRIYELLIPAKVVRDNDLRFGQFVKYVDEEGTMVGERGKWSDNTVRFKGWNKICRRNWIEEKDVIKCELLHAGKLVHSIKISVAP